MSTAAVPQVSLKMTKKKFFSNIEATSVSVLQLRELQLTSLEA